MKLTQAGAYNHSTSIWQQLPQIQVSVHLAYYCPKSLLALPLILPEIEALTQE